MTIIIAVIVAIAIILQFTRAKRKTNNNVRAYTGGLGSGKTYSAVQDAIKRVRRAQLIYNIRGITGKMPLLRRWWPTPMERPALYSNIPIKWGKHTAHILTLRHLVMLDHIPQNSIVLIDELGQFASQHDHDNVLVILALQEFIRLFRHYVGGYLILTDQSSDNIVKPIRQRLGVVYSLDNFRRLWGILPFYRVDVTTLQTVDGAVTQYNVQDGGRHDYFIGVLPYRWWQRLFNSARYESRCYRPLYYQKFGDKTKYTDDTAKIYDRKTLYTDYLIDMTAGVPNARRKNQHQHFAKLLQTYPPAENVAYMKAGLMKKTKAVKDKGRIN